MSSYGIWGGCTLLRNYAMEVPRNEIKPWRKKKEYHGKYNHGKKQSTSKKAKKTWLGDLQGRYVDSNRSMENIETLDNTSLGDKKWCRSLQEGCHGERSSLR